MSLSLLLDENISQTVAAQVKYHRPALSVESVHTWRDGTFEGCPDRTLLQAAHAEGWTLVTYDQKTIPPLLAEMYAEGESHAGVIFVDDQTISGNEFTPTSQTYGWYKNIASDVPFVIKNFGTVPDSGFTDVVLQPGHLAFHPGPQDQFSIIRFTATQSGSYHLDSSFTPATTNGTTTDVHVLENGVSLFDGVVTGTYDAPTSAPSFFDSFLLNAGDTIDFAVGYGTNGNFYRDSTGISATLTTPAAVPEASSVVSLGLLLLLGVGGLVVSRRHKAGGVRGAI